MAKIVTFFGGDTQVGTTMTAASVAQALHEKSNKVLLILASLEIEENWFSDAPTSDLGVMLRLSNIIREDVLSAIVPTDNFDVIHGTKDALKKAYYEPPCVETIVKLIENDYDYIVIDGGSDASLALGCEALYTADRRYYVLTGNMKCINRFRVTRTNIIAGLGLESAGSKDDKFILNKVTKRNSLNFDLQATMNELGMEGYSLPMYETPEYYEFNRIPPLSKAGSGYAKVISQIVEDISSIEKKGKK